MTTHTLTNLEKIRQACIKANPSILEPVFGCEVVYFYTHHLNSKSSFEASKRGHIIKQYPQTNAFSLVLKGNKKPCDKYLHEFEIKGREIRLADVLLALHRKSEFYVVGTSGLIMPKNDTNPNGVEDKWNLYKDNLSHQSPETLQFLADLL